MAPADGRNGSAGDEIVATDLGTGKATPAVALEPACSNPHGVMLALLPQSMKIFY